MKEREARERRARGRGGSRNDPPPQKKGKAGRGGKEGGGGKEASPEEKAFAAGLLDACPRCGAEGFRNEDQQADHLKECNDSVLHQAYKKKRARQDKAGADRDAAADRQQEVNPKQRCGSRSPAGGKP
jgi:hypothetical protein